MGSAYFLNTAFTRPFPHSQIVDVWPTAPIAVCPCQQTHSFLDSFVFSLLSFFDKFFALELVCPPVRVFFFCPLLLVSSCSVLHRQLRASPPFGPSFGPNDRFLLRASDYFLPNPPHRQIGYCLPTTFRGLWIGTVIKDFFCLLPLRESFLTEILPNRVVLNGPRKTV